MCTLVRDSVFFAVLIFTGTQYSPFALHIEDKGLCSINYGHFGSNKVWYGVAQRDYHNVVKLLSKYVCWSSMLFSHFCRLYKTEYDTCDMYHTHKNFFLSIEYMTTSDIEFYMVWILCRVLH